MDILMYILLVVSFGLAILTAVLSYSSIPGKILGTIVITFGYWLITCILIIILDSILWNIADKKETVLKTNIYGINKESTTTSRFIIGCGYIKNDYRYSYYVRYGVKQSYKLDDVSATNSVIIEDEEVKPYIIKWKNIEVLDKNKWKNWLLLQTKRTDVVDDVEIHVPKGTIVQELRGKL